MSDPLHDAAVAMLSGAEAPAESPAPSEAPAPAPTTPAEAPAPDAPPPETPAPAPQESEEQKLLADLEARKQARLAKPSDTSSEIAQLRAELQALKSQTPQPTGADIAKLIAEHGEIEGLRKAGIDPLQFWEGFRKKALTNDPKLGSLEQQIKQLADENKALRERYETDTKTGQERAQQEHAAQLQRAYLRTIDDPTTGLKHLPHLDAVERMEETERVFSWATRNEYDISHFTDAQLAKLVDSRIAERIARAGGTDAAAQKTTPNVPVTDGAKPSGTSPTSLTNDLASQSTGRDRVMSDMELRQAAIRVLEQGVQEA